MKRNSCISIVGLAILCVNLPAFAQKEGTNYDNPTGSNNSAANDSRDRDLYVRTNPEHLGNFYRAKDFLGAEIKGSQDQRLGKVKDLAIDLQNGRIVEVIVGTGGVLGVDEKFVAVPPGQFTYDEASKTLQLRGDKQELKSAPTFKLSAWEEYVSQSRIQEVYQYYSARPYFSVEPQATKTVRNPAQLGEVERASKLIGTTVRNLQDERLGKIETLVMDLPGGRVVEVVLGTGGFLGMGDELSAIPPQSFKYGVHPDVLTLDTTKDALSRAPHFKLADWRKANSPDQVLLVYQTYKVEPYFTSKAVDNTAQNVRERDANSVTPLDQGNSQADMDITTEIRKQIMAANGLSVDAHNVKVITVNGKVTLRGPVANEQEKQTIADIAAKVTPNANVDNQLQVTEKSNPDSSK